MKKVKLGEVVELVYGKALKKADRAPGPVPVVGSSGIIGTHERGITSGPTIVVGRKGSIGSVTWIDGPSWPIDTAYYVNFSHSQLDPRWVYWLLKQLGMENMNKSAAVPGLNRDDVYRLSALLPPLDEQRRIAAILDNADAIRQKRRRAIAHLDTFTQSIFQDMFDSFDGGRVPLSDIGQWHSGGTPPKTGANYYSGDIPWFKSGDLGRINPQLPSGHISSLAISDTAAKLIEPNSILVGMYDTAAMKSSIATFSASCNQAVAFSWIDPEKADIVFIYYAIQSVRAKTLELRRGIRQKNLNLSMIKSIMIPFPSRDNQARFANAVDQIHSIERKVASIEADALYQSLQSRAFRGEL